MCIDWVDFLSVYVLVVRLFCLGRRRRNSDGVWEYGTRTSRLAHVGPGTASLATHAFCARLPAGGKRPASAVAPSSYPSASASSCRAFLLSFATARLLSRTRRRRGGTDHTRRAAGAAVARTPPPRPMTRPRDVASGGWCQAPPERPGERTHRDRAVPPVPRARTALTSWADSSQTSRPSGRRRVDVAAEVSAAEAAGICLCQRGRRRRRRRWRLRL